MTSHTRGHALIRVVVVSLASLTFHPLLVTGAKARDSDQSECATRFRECNELESKWDLGSGSFECSFLCQVKTRLSSRSGCDQMAVANKCCAQSGPCREIEAKCNRDQNYKGYEATKEQNYLLIGKISIINNRCSKWFCSFDLIFLDTKINNQYYDFKYRCVFAYSKVDSFLTTIATTPPTTVTTPVTSTPTTTTPPTTVTTPVTSTPTTTTPPTTTPPTTVTPPVTSTPTTTTPPPTTTPTTIIVSSPSPTRTISSLPTSQSAHGSSVIRPTATLLPLDPNSLGTLAQHTKKSSEKKKSLSAPAIAVVAVCSVLGIVLLLFIAVIAYRRHFFKCVGPKFAHHTHETPKKNDQEKTRLANQMYSFCSSDAQPPGRNGSPTESSAEFVGTTLYETIGETDTDLHSRSENDYCRLQRPDSSSMAGSEYNTLVHDSTNGGRSRAFEYSQATPIHSLTPTENAIDKTNDTTGRDDETFNGRYPDKCHGRVNESSSSLGRSPEITNETEYSLGKRSEMPNEIGHHSSQDMNHQQGSGKNRNNCIPENNNGYFLAENTRSNRDRIHSEHSYSEEGGPRFESPGASRDMIGSGPRNDEYFTLESNQGPLTASRDETDGGPRNDEYFTLESNQEPIATSPEALESSDSVDSVYCLQSCNDHDDSSSFREKGTLDYDGDGRVAAAATGDDDEDDENFDEINNTNTILNQSRENHEADESDVIHDSPESKNSNTILGKEVSDDIDNGNENYEDMRSEFSLYCLQNVQNSNLGHGNDSKNTKKETTMYDNADGNNDAIDANYNNRIGEEDGRPELHQQWRPNYSSEMVLEKDIPIMNDAGNGMRESEESDQDHGAPKEEGLYLDLEEHSDESEYVEVEEDGSSLDVDDGLEYVDTDFTLQLNV